MVNPSICNRFFIGLHQLENLADVFFVSSCIFRYLLFRNNIVHKKICTAHYKLCPTWKAVTENFCGCLFLKHFTEKE